jgi:hypothetical protein
MNSYRLADNVTAVGNSATVELKNVDLRNRNNTGLVHVYQLAPNGTTPTITQLAFRIEGSIDGVNWAPIVPVTALTATGAVATTNTTNGGIFRAVSLAPFMRFVCTTAPATTSGSTSGGAMLCY